MEDHFIEQIEALTQDQIRAILSNLQKVLTNSEGIKTVATAVFLRKIKLEQLQETGQLTPDLRQKLEEEIVEQRNIIDEALWLKATTTMQLVDFEMYLSLFPVDGAHTSMAQTMIAGIKARQDLLSQKGKLLEELKHNINAYRSGKLIEAGVTKDDIILAGIDLPKKIQDIYENKCVQLALGTTPKSIPCKRTEVYFWGVPGSGKTCTLAAILKTAKIVEDAEMQGSGLVYFQRLANIFNNGVGTLPPGTEKEKYQTYSFDLLDDKSCHYPITFIDLPGELFSDFTNARQDETFIENKQSFADFLALISDNQNPKYHFFIIDVANTDIDSATGLTQEQLLANAATYFKQHTVFNDQTAGIAILVTKSDLLSRDDEECYRLSTDLLNKNYSNFISTLKSIAREKRLIPTENSPLDLIPFSIGEVYLQDKCIFNPQKSQEVIKYLIEHIARRQKSPRFMNFLNS